MLRLRLLPLAALRNVLFFALALAHIAHVHSDQLAEDCPSLLRSALDRVAILERRLEIITSECRVGSVGANSGSANGGSGDVVDVARADVEDFSDEDVDLCDLEWGSSVEVRPRSQRPRLYDGFMFFNELDILEVRLAELYPVVERFVLVESNSTHSNKHKPLHYEENKERFAAYADKIIHVVVKDTPTDEGVTGSTDEHWKREKFQRDAIVRGLATISTQRDDIVLISDVDEIPRRDAALSLLTCDIRTKVFPIEMRTYMYYYDLNWMWFHGAPGEEVPKYWTYGPKAVYRHQLDTITPSVFRTYHPATHSQTIYPKCAGWHLSYFGGVKRIQAKLQAYAHQEFNRPDVKDDVGLATRMSTGRDVLNRKGGVDGVHLENSRIMSAGHELKDGIWTGAFIGVPHLLIERPSDFISWLPEVMTTEADTEMPQETIPWTRRGGSASDVNVWCDDMGIDAGVRANVEGLGDCTCTSTCHVSSALKEDCGWPGITSVQCQSEGCCWDDSDARNWCYYQRRKWVLDENVTERKGDGIHNDAVRSRVTEADVLNESFDKSHQNGNAGVARTGLASDMSTAANAAANAALAWMGIGASSTNNETST